MANDCAYKARIFGSRRDQVDQFFKAMRFQDFENGYYMARVFNAESDKVRTNGTVWWRNVEGDCAWSVRACMLDEDYGRLHCVDYGNPIFKVFRGSSGEIHYANIGMTAQKLCRALSCGIEIWSREPMYGFQEHYLIDSQGNMRIDEVMDWECEPEDGAYEGGFDNYGIWTGKCIDFLNKKGDKKDGKASIDSTRAQGEEPHCGTAQGGA